MENSKVEKKKVLFLCTGNSCRSQMAEGLVNHFLPHEWIAYSAGTQPADQVHTLAILVMSELGIDITNSDPKNVSEFRDVDFDLVITLCDDAAENCPLWLGKGKVVHKSFPDPAKATGSKIEQTSYFRTIRAEIHLEIFDYLSKVEF
ncbi:MAG: arsenate reductase ArsC [Anaerolineales bacterium]|nr:arsenate reductase ArsC [Anaerolineales bacterium]